MALLAVQTITRTGIVPTYAAATGGGGDTVAPSRDTWIHVKNGGGSPVDVQVITTAKVLNDISIGNTYVTVAAGGEKMIGSVPPELVADATTGLASITYSGVTSVTVGAFKINQP